jgi:hypothetical protein
MQINDAYTGELFGKIMKDEFEWHKIVVIYNGADAWSGGIHASLKKW